MTIERTCCAIPSTKAASISRHAIVQTTDIGPYTCIAEFAVIRAGTRLGQGVTIHPHVVIESGVDLGDGVEVFPGAYLGKEPKAAGALSRPVSYKRRIVVGAGTSICPHAVVYYDVDIGEDCLIGDGASIREQTRIGAHSVIGRYVAINYGCTIGARTKIMDLAVITGNAHVGNDVFIGMMASTSNDNDPGISIWSEDLAGPDIRDGATIATGAILLPGVTIGKGAMVAAGAVVSHSAREGWVVMGVPARHARRVSP